MNVGTSFSRTTGIAAIELLENVWQEKARLTRELLRLGPEVAAKCDAGSAADRFNHLIKLADTPGYRLADGSSLFDALVRRAVAASTDDEAEPLRTSRAYALFVRSLEIDGFSLAADGLNRTAPAELELPEAQDDVARILDAYGLSISKGHLDQALEAHLNGHWASANAQLRSFFEGLLDEIACVILPDAASINPGQARREALAGERFLRRDLNEWSGEGKNFVNGLLKRLHPEGSHPGLSDQANSTFRRHTVLIAARLFLVRLEQLHPVS